jgi:cytochrome c biogenesis protein CcmG/thiol:disulfide interchange protein DsbE
MMTEENNLTAEQIEEKLEKKPWWAVVIFGGVTCGTLLAWGGMIALLVVVAIQLRTSTQGTVQIGEEVPDFTLYTFDGDEYTLSELRGKVVVVNFWASWCNPCEDEAAELQQAWEHYQPGGEVVFLGIAWTDTDTPAAEYIERFQISYPNGHDLGTTISQKFRISGVPETYIIDRDGVLADAQIGPYSSLMAIFADINAVLAQ